MTFIWKKGLPFITVKLNVAGQAIVISNALIDSGAASSLFNIEALLSAGLNITQSDVIVEMVGIGGTESVFQRSINHIEIDSVKVKNPIVQFGQMEYGFVIDGIIGSDILASVGAIIDYNTESITIPTQS